MNKQSYLVLTRQGCLVLVNNIHILPAPQIMRFWKQPAWPHEIRRIIEMADDVCASINIPFDAQGSAYVLEMGGLKADKYVPLCGYAERDNKIIEAFEKYPWLRSIL